MQTQHTRPDLTGKLAAVVGGGRSGKAAAQLLRELGATVRLVDANPETIKDPALVSIAHEMVTGPHEPEQFRGVDLVVMSPGVPLATVQPHLQVTDAPEVWAELELAARCIDTPIIGLTGTNGKTTTVSLIAAMLEQAGKKVFLGGNIGTPLSSFVLSGSKADVLVLEISSFQLQTSHTLRPTVGVLLNFSPNHLDYHKDIDEYLDAKLNLFAKQEPEDLALFPVDLATLARERKPGAGKLVLFAESSRFNPGKLLGAHNQANMEAAFKAAAHFGVTENQAQAAIDGFAPLAHRLEPLAEKHGVLYVNDSKSTTVDSLRAALQAMDRPVLLLAGGVFKGGDLGSLKPLLQERVRRVCLFGDSEEIFRKAWNGAVDVIDHDPTLEEAFARVVDESGPGEAVLLSPATASFDLFANYKERGDRFRSLVEALP